MKVSQLFESDLPEEFLATLPSVCEDTYENGVLKVRGCGYELEITESLSQLYCPNPRCPEKVVQRLVALLQDLGVKNMGESKCRQFLDYFGSSNPYDILLYEPSDGPLYEGCSADFSQQIYDQIDSKREMMLWEYVRIGNLPGIRDGARHLFVNYDNIEDFYEDLDEGGIAFVQDLLSIKKGSKSRSNVDSDGYEDILEDSGDEEESVSIRAVKIYENLMFFKEDILSAVTGGFVDIISMDTPVCNIAISRAVGAPYGSKEDFVAQMNKNYGHKVHLNFLKAVTNDCQFLLWSGVGEPTSKVSDAMKKNRKAIITKLTELYNDGEDLSDYGLTIDIFDDSDIEDNYDDYIEDLDVSKLNIKLINAMTGAQFEDYLKSL